jgi:hypothetical protein
MRGILKSRAKKIPGYEVRRLRGSEHAEHLATCGSVASAFPVFERRNAFAEVADALVEIARGCAHQYRQAGSVAALFPNNIFNAVKVRRKV